MPPTAAPINTKTRDPLSSCQPHRHHPALSLAQAHRMKKWARPRRRRRGDIVKRPRLLVGEPALQNRVDMAGVMGAASSIPGPTCHPACPRRHCYRSSPGQHQRLIRHKKREGRLAPSLVRYARTLLLFADVLQASSARSALVASTITLRAASVSSQPRVLRPQSGLTHSRSAGICLAALRIRSSIQPWLGTFGEWMS